MNPAAEPTPRTERVQFGITELLLTATMAFLGMKLSILFLYATQPALGCGLAIAATIFGAFLGVRCSTANSRRPLRWMIAGIFFGWFFAVWLGVFAHAALAKHFEEAFILIVAGCVLVMPTMLAFIYFSRAQRENWTFHPPTVITWGLAFAMVAVVVGAIPSLFRSRIDANETAPAAACKAFAEAEEIYHRTDYTHTGLQYASSLHSLIGSSGELALIDKTFANAELGSAAMTPKAGYFFKVLTSQGPAATGGRKSYLDETGKMTRGYAILALPARYGDSGNDCFIINNNGTIFQKDLGPDTPTVAPAITEFDPDTTWVPTQ